MDTPPRSRSRERGLRHRFRDWRHGRSRSRASQEVANLEQPPLGRESGPKSAEDTNDRAVDVNKFNLQDGMQANPSSDANQAPSDLTVAGFPGLDIESIPSISVSEDPTPPHGPLVSQVSGHSEPPGSATTGIPGRDIVSSPSISALDQQAPPCGPLHSQASGTLDPPSSTSASATIVNESSALWQSAFDALRNDKPSLIDHYEIVLKDQVSIPQDTDLPEQLAEVAASQRRKVENKQWKLQWLGKPQTVRDTIERILDLTNRSAGLIAIGMSFAPPYVSIPWSAVTVLIPLMMNEFTQTRGAINGLETVTKLIFSYRMAEDAFLGSAETRGQYKKSVFDLYKKILEYQALAIQYFGRSTLLRFGKNILGSTEWQGMPGAIANLDDDSRRSLGFLGLKSQLTGFVTLAEFLKKQEEKIKSIAQNALTKRDEATQVFDWISSIPIESDHKEVRDKLGEAHFLSGRWFLDDEEVESWRNWKTGHQYLWLRGGVGSGKSSLASILIEDLVQTPDGLLGFFYCSRKAEKNQQKTTARNAYDNVLRSLLAQISVSADGTTIFGPVKQSSDRDTRRVLAGYGLSSKECIAMLIDLFSAGADSHMTLIIDALDECADYDSLLQDLQDLQKVSHSYCNVRICLTSRFEVQVQDYFPDAKPVTIGVQNKVDIERFLKFEIPNRRPGSGMTDDQAERLHKALLDRADGMFMWAKIQVNIFLHEIKSKRIKQAEDIKPMLEDLEGSKAVKEKLLEEAYDVVYKLALGDNELVKQKRREEIVITSLRWALCGFRTLTLRELAYAASVTSDGSIADDVQEGLLLEYCSNLLVEDATGIVRLAHLSVRHYLEARMPPEFSPSEAHLQAALTCLYFANSLRYREISHMQGEFFQEGDVTLTKSFYSYVAAYWSRHCREATENEEMQRLMDSFAARSNADRGSTSGYEKDQSPRLAVRPANRPSPADVTRVDVVDRESLKHSLDPDVGITTELQSSSSPMSSDFAKLWFRQSHPNDDYEIMVAQHVARGANLSIQDKFGNTALHISIRLRSLGSVKKLLEAGASVDSRNRNGNTALHLAAMYHFDEGIQQLLLFGSNKNARNLRGETPLHLALMFCNNDASDILISADVDANARDHQGNTPFHHASYLGQLGAAESLLLTGYRPYGVNQGGDTPLSLAIKSNSEAMIRLLLQHDVELRSKDISESQRRGNWDVVRQAASAQQQLRERGSQPSRARNLQLAVRFEGASKTCQHCNFPRWILSSSTGATYSHWPSYLQLRDSARSGCPLCNFFSVELEEHCALFLSSPNTQIIVSFQLSSDQGSRFDRKDSLIVTMGELARLTFECCLDNASQDDPITSLFTGRNVAQMPSSPSAVDLINTWITNCESTHVGCREHGLSHPRLPTRVLDVGTGNGNSPVRLIQPGRQNGRYAYLSFPWGSHPGHIFVTTRATIDCYMKEVPYNKLPATLADAVTITRLLGLRYLWIDALCIAQGPDGDFATEAPKMSDYLQKATFAIIAAAGKSMGERILQPRQAPLLYMDLMCFDPGGSAFGMRWERKLYLRQPLQTASEALASNVFRRSWMIQEALLPKKLLIWGTDQSYWNCRTCLRSEGSTLIQQPILKLEPRSLDIFSPDSEIRKSFFPWYKLLMLYSRAVTSHESDRLLALGALARYFDPTSRYAAGLWVNDFQNGLLWMVDDIFSSRSPRSYIAPSWSWASLNAPITYCLWIGVRQDLISPRSAFSVLNVQPAFDRNHSYGAIKNGGIEVSAMTRQASIFLASENCEYFFDQLAYEDEWHRGLPFVFMFICPWSANWTSLPGHARCLGLILCNEDLRGKTVALPCIDGRVDYEQPFVRVGLFLGIDYDPEMPDWTRRTLDIDCKVSNSKSSASIGAWQRASRPIRTASCATLPKSRSRPQRASSVS